MKNLKKIILNVQINFWPRKLIKEGILTEEEYDKLKNEVKEEV